ncbi:MAG: hypothetical protein CHACPFDD_03226 [Phycisphaerae bacterium]|nr:hypothetical protein [Phycisphaerae bacterium]
MSEAIHAFFDTARPFEELMAGLRDSTCISFQRVEDSPNAFFRGYCLGFLVDVFPSHDFEDDCHLHFGAYRYVGIEVWNRSKVREDTDQLMTLIAWAMARDVVECVGGKAMIVRDLHTLLGTLP